MYYKRFGQMDLTDRVAIETGLCRGEYINKGLFKEEAVERAIDDCIREDVLADILEKHRSEAATMILEEYDEELHIKNEKEISYDEGRNDGINEGTDAAFVASIKNLMDSLKLNAEQAMDALKIPAEDQKRYAKML